MNRAANPFYFVYDFVQKELKGWIFLTGGDRVISFKYETAGGWIEHLSRGFGIKLILLLKNIILLVMNSP